MMRSGGRSQTLGWTSTAGKAAFGAVPSGIVEFRRDITMAQAIAGDAPEEHLRLTLPGHAREFVDRGDQQVGQQTVDLFVDDDNRQALVRRLGAAEGASAQVVAAKLESPPAPGFGRFHDNIAPGLDLAAAPGAMRELDRRAAAADCAAAGPGLAAALLDRLVDMPGPVGRAAIANPEPDAEGARAPAFEARRGG